MVYGTSNEPINAFALSIDAGVSAIQTSLEWLRPHLPVSLPLYRRLQFGRFSDSSTILTNLRHSDAAQRRLGNLNGDLNQAGSGVLNGNSQTTAQNPWVLTFVDRSTRPETEVWMFGSWEADPPPPDAREAWDEIDGIMLRLVQRAKDLPLPESMHQAVLEAQPNGDDQRDTGGYSRNDYGGHASNPNIMLWGAIHERSLEVLQGIGVLSQAYKTGFAPNHTFLFDVPSMATPPPLPEGLVWGEMKPQHFALVRSRTQIPRQDSTMAVLPSLAIYPASSDVSAAPIAWAFVGLDASLTTLHVESEWRGRGLAKMITTKLFREKMYGFWEKGVEQIAHGYVIVGNKASEGMCRSLGGKSEWECYWLRVDLSMV